jgi:non-specific serine/threonine protein kinase
MSLISGDVYEFGPYRLDVTQRLFTREGTVVPLPPKTFELLLLLVKTPGRAFSKQELMTALWPETFVEEANLSFQTSMLRKALGEGGAHWIETIPKHGYRFTAEVRMVPSTDQAEVAPHEDRLPQQLTRFIGRRREILEVRIALSETRLVTLTGPGGIGKTRLALQVATDVIREYASGVWFADLAPVSDPELVPQTVASVLGLHEELGQPLLETLRVHLSSKSLLLVLDNCEHLVGACAHLVDTLLRTCSQLHILATSRESLSIIGEEIVQVPPLALPDQSPGTATIPDAEAVLLFADRARLVKSTFAITSSNAAEVMQICVALEGIPLAIELAASRVRVLSPDQIVAKLHDRLGLLTGGSRTGAARHRTLVAAIDWSYNLLSAPEKQLFHRLAIFSGGWTLEAAEAVCVGDGLVRTDVLGLLFGLVDKSLVLTEERRGNQRYRFMVTLHEYAQKCLRRTDQQAALRRTHAEFFTEFAIEGEGRLLSPDQEVWLDRLTLESDNLRAALNWATTADAQLALRLSTALSRFWYLRGYWGEGRRWLTDLLKLEGVHIHPKLRVRALNAAALMVLLQSDHAAARAIVEEALTLARSCGDEREAAVALNYAAADEGFRGEFEAARLLWEESLAIQRRLGDRWLIAYTLNNLGSLALLQTDYLTARRLFDESLTTFRDNEDKHGIVMVLVNSSDLLGRMGDDAAARAAVEEALALAQILGDKSLLPAALNGLGEVVCRQGDHQASRVLNEEALEISRHVGDKGQGALALLSLGTEAEHLEAYATARSTFETTLTLVRDLGDKPKLAVALNCLARMTARDGHYAAAKVLHEESLELSRRMGLRDRIAESLLGLANIAHLQGDQASALALCRSSLAILFEIGHKCQLPRVLEHIGLLLLLQGEPARGASLLGVSQALREITTVCRPPNERAEYEQHIECSRRELGHQRFTAAWARGRAMTMEQAVHCALNEEP